MKKLIKVLIVALVALISIQVHGIIFPDEIKSNDEIYVDKLTEETFNDITKDDIEINNPLLVLVNKKYKLPDNFKTDLIDLDGIRIDKDIKDDLLKMIEDSKKEGIKMTINEAYRESSYQQEVYDTKVRESMTRGSSYKEAQEFADSIAAKPGHSEHETGLALDFGTYGNEEDKYDMWEWLANNSYRYGFVLRYPAHKTGESGYIYEAWHYRYVGKDAAYYMFKNDLILEELHDLFK